MIKLKRIKFDHKHDHPLLGIVSDSFIINADPHKHWIVSFEVYPGLAIYWNGRNYFADMRNNVVVLELCRRCYKRVWDYSVKKFLANINEA